MARFYIGQPVVCINDRFSRKVFRRFPEIRNLPKRGAVYTVRANIEMQVTFITLRELKNPTIRYPRGGGQAEAGFWEERFEPATDISELKKAEKSHEIFTKKPSPEWDRKVKRRKKVKEDA